MNLPIVNKETRAKEIKFEGELWIAHIEKLVALSRASTDSTCFSQIAFNSDVASNCCALINWLAILENLKERVSQNDLITFLNQHFNWDSPAAEIFLKSVRNPVAHMGRFTSFGEYEDGWRNCKAAFGEDILFTGSIDVLADGENGFWAGQPNPVMEMGYCLQENPLPKDTRKEMQCIFYYPTIKSLIEGAVEAVSGKVHGMSDTDFATFEKLNDNLSLCRVPLPSSASLE